MDTRSPKRRKTAGDTSPHRERQQLTPRRASYMSPTKASLARFNPGLLKSPHLMKSPVRPSSRRIPSPAIGASRIQAEEYNDLGGARAETYTSTREDVPSMDAINGGLFDDLDLDSSRAGLSTSNVDVAPVTQADNEASAVEGEQEDAGARALARAREKEEVQQELSALKGSCRRIEQYLDRVKGGASDYSMDGAAAEKLALILDDADTATEGLNARPVTALLNSMLPFSNPAGEEVQPDEEDIDVPSHRPLELEDPLPCLQLFTKLRSSLHVDLPRTGRDGNGGVVSLQAQHLQISDAKRLFSASIDFEVVTSAQEDVAPQITKLSVSHVPGWALRELQQWIGERKDDRDLGCLTYGLGSYFEMSEKRAEVWQKCQQRYARLCRDSIEGEKENRDLPGKARAGDEAIDSLQLGRSSLILQDEEVLLRVEWAIQLDWTGEAKSSVTARAAFAQAYLELDTRRSLAKVPDTFARLVKDRGVFAAVSAMASVLFS